MTQKIVTRLTEAAGMVMFWSAVALILRFIIFHG
jgi:hypothetical protein